MRRLLGWALLPALLLAAGAASAASLDIRNAALRVVVIPEARPDVSVTVLKTNPRLPIRVFKDMAGRTVVDGGPWLVPFGRPVECDAGGGVHVWGVGHVADAELPRILVRMPPDARISAGGGVFGSIAAADRLTLDVSGCGDWAVANVQGRLSVVDSGSGTVRTGTAGQMALQASGSGDIATRAASSGLDAGISGSGTITVEQASGPVRVHNSGSGDVSVNGGQASDVDLHVSGSGDVQFRGAAETLSAGLSGDGKIAAGRVNRSLDVDISGSGDMTVREASGAVRAHISGSGALSVAGGHAGNVDAHLSGSGDMQFAGAADTVNASTSGSGDLRLARVTGAVVSTASGSGRVIVGR